MTDFQPILIVLVLGLAAFAASLWRKIAALEQRFRKREEELSTKEQEIERLRREAKERREELEQTRHYLQEAKSKLKRQQQREQTLPAKRKLAGEDGTTPMLSAIVHLTQEELEANYQRTVSNLEAELVRTRSELQRFRELAQENKAERAEGSVVTGSQTASVQATVPAAISGDAELTQRIRLLEEQLASVTRHAEDKKNALEKEVRKAEASAKSAIRRAQSNHQLYQIARGQLEVAEGKLALMRRKYEGAKTPGELRTEQKRQTSVPGEPASARASGEENANGSATVEEQATP